MKKIGLVTAICLAAVVAVTGCSSQKAPESAATSAAETTTAAASESSESEAEETTAAEASAKADGGETTILIAAAASLEKCFTGQLIPLFEEQNPGIKVEGTYDSSGKLQTQIEEGAEVDVFFSAAIKQMDALKEEGLMADDTITNLLVNKIVLIVPDGQEGNYKEFTDVTKADQIAIGDPESVPAGQYAKESLTNLGIWDEVEAKASLGTNVTEVLNWVSEGSAGAGIVYATDAAQKADQVKVVAEAPADSVKNPIYPVGMVKASAHPEEAKAFIQFLKSEEAIKIFEENGFSAAQ